MKYNVTNYTCRRRSNRIGLDVENWETQLYNLFFQRVSFFRSWRRLPLLRSKMEDDCFAVPHTILFAV